MKYYLVAILDNKLGYFQRPVIANDPREATRGFIDTMGNENNPLAKNPADYDLYLIGEITMEENEEPTTENKYEILFKGSHCEIVNTEE